MNSKKMCLDKRQFSTMVKAYRSIEEQKIRFNDQRFKRVYKCPICSMYHITIQEEQKREMSDEHLIAVMRRSGFSKEDTNRYLTMGK